MIYKIFGTIEEKDLDTCVVRTNSGVCYSINCTSAVSSSFSINDTCEIFTQLIVREDSMLLYGFVDNKEKYLFKLLSTVQGIGSKSALSILSDVGKEPLVQAIQAEDEAMICKANGIGPKIAKRIITELKPKVSKANFPIQTQQGQTSSLENDVVSALLNLGFKKLDSQQSAKEAALQLKDSDPSFEELFKNALKRIRR